MELDFGSECSSGCESGWTFYLGHSMYRSDLVEKYKYTDKEDDDDDDMSMVSDASSGPPHVVQDQEQEQEFSKHNNGVFNGWKKEKIFITKGRKTQDLTCFLDETASSSFFNFSHAGNNQASLGESSKVIADDSKEHFQGESSFQDQFGGFKSCVSSTR
ncbi:protein SOB FIVE-LIKE 5-like [Rutidosis leptorrhynchoides]|uniref:protein SOB FIVE-LIKE 5-like n=1 Tax=Rutidosis leptorrhynchoides TaxID=125765 RepID=UPI003A994B3D